MPLTIEEVRDCKFHLARRNGYEPVDVDNFVDQVETTLEELYAQIETLKGSEPGSGVAPGSDESALAAAREEIERLKAELEEARSGESSDVADLRRQLDEHRALVGTREQELNDTKKQLFEVKQAEGKTEKLVLESGPEASAAVTRLLEMATKQADDLVSEARAEADRRLAEADAKAAEVTAAATRKRDELESQHEARRNELDTQITTRRDDLISTLETEHQDLAERVAQLRAYEAKYRESALASLASHIENIKNAVFEPEEKPALLEVEPGTNSTPELDKKLTGGNAAAKG